MSLFNSVELKSDDPILGLAVLFQKDTRPNKVNLGIGSYKNGEGKPQVLLAVRKAERNLLEKNLDKEYLPILGCQGFIKQALPLIFGAGCKAYTEGTIAAAQTIGATGALRIGAEFLVQCKISNTAYFSNPTWPNHISIFARGGMKCDYYPYYDAAHHSLNFKEMKQSVSQIPAGSTVVFQPCCHNPTGVVPSFEEWKELSSLMLASKLLPFFDISYQGLGKGIEEDAKVVRHFAEQGHSMLVAASFSKNFGLYGERVGILSVLTPSADEAKRVSSQIKLLIRGNYSLPPLHGERIVKEILENQELKKEWLAELETMRTRIREMRRLLLIALSKKGAASEFEHILQQEGMFSFSGLKQEMCLRLAEEFGIYMPLNGRINIAGLNEKNINYVADSIISVM